MRGVRTMTTGTEGTERLSSVTERTSGNERDVERRRGDPSVGR